MTQYHTYDIETYPNLFTCAFKHGNERRLYEVSHRINQAVELCEYMDWLGANNCTMVGFNSIGFDYPVLHYLYQLRSGATVELIKAKADAIIATDWNDRFKHNVWASDHVVRQLDLYLINHFDNKSCSLKMIEYIRSAYSIEELPYDPTRPLTRAQMLKIIEYNHHDVTQTDAFLDDCMPAIKFRDEMGLKYPSIDFTNFNDTKIGKAYFTHELNKAGVDTHTRTQGRRVVKQTLRPSITIGDVILPSVRFDAPEFNKIITLFKNRTLVADDGPFIKLKGVMDGVSATVNGFTYEFGLGGIHGSIESQAVYADDNYEIVDLDVASYYPNIAIANRLFPEHLSDRFCDIYKDVYEQRKTHAKGTTENAAMKLALNGVYGDSNNKYSQFYDPKFTLAITVNGQLLLCMLSEWLHNVIPTIEMIQINTDGLTVRISRGDRHTLDKIATNWEAYTGLELESVNYKRMFIRDVNNYIGEYEDGTTKRKGAYAVPQLTTEDWPKDHSNKVSTMAAYEHLINGVSIEKFIRNHGNFNDFTLRTKVTRADRVVLEDNTATDPDLTDPIAVAKWLKNRPLDDDGMPYDSQIHTSNMSKRGVIWKRKNSLMDEFYCDRQQVARDIMAAPHPELNDVETSHDQQKVTRYYITVNGGTLIKIMKPLPKAPDKYRRFELASGWLVTCCNNIYDATEDINYAYYIEAARKLVDPIIGDK